MPTQTNMGPKNDIYRATLEYEQEPTDFSLDPVTGRYVRIVTGPAVTKEQMIGPYVTIAPIKAHVTRHRGHMKNLRIKSIEKATGWEEVPF